MSGKACAAGAEARTNGALTVSSCVSVFMSGGGAGGGTVGNGSSGRAGTSTRAGLLGVTAVPFSPDTLPGVWLRRLRALTLVRRDVVLSCCSKIAGSGDAFRRLSRFILAIAPSVLARTTSASESELVVSNSNELVLVPPGVSVAIDCADDSLRPTAPKRC